MWSFDAWLADVEVEFWKAHNEVMDATGFRNVLDSLASTSFSPSSIVAHVKADAKDFFKAVNWSEPFFRYLAAFHVLILIAVFYFTRGPVSDERLITVCVALTVTVLAGMGLNTLGDRYASALFEEKDVNYFTEDGIFVAVVFMAPLIVLIVCLQVRMGCRVVKLMVQVKQAQVKRTLRREAKAKSDAVEASSEVKKQQ